MKKEEMGKKKWDPGNNASNSQEWNGKSKEDSRTADLEIKP